MKFILTKELGKLATWLRILGFDAVYFKEDNLSSLIITALRESRIILTRNHRLTQRRGLKIIVIKAEDVKGQLKELNLKVDEELMFSRCVLCNIELVGIEKEKIKERVPEYVFQTQDNFFICSGCQRIYWQGTHWGNVKKILSEVSS